ncbi:NAD(P)/FAD-dependent oxidoreductase [Pseudogulbenkiania ferrooxidans]|uniref:FAD-dependent pyridine nucleotide-disulphide oxidoreductase n=1 Tax=Pseudogulbenkiania ferrooxidans 2002 TaxID=279714 RepID=B9Z2B9_9NEIS|nr:NAD(P)/FAD-dependent oxidoreductase [Pseudogulbenkiania ferrooxidans]EEG08722.1 FAD-dependent pyridine nucleotide-disulphide oxidoreductase [Pseudogulbenkiania ferrooxidans 2002]
MPTSNMQKIVIVGGGAGGLALATRLGDTLGRRQQAEITLVDCSRTHIWKPLLHEIAAGSMTPAKEELDYLAQARWHGFRFCLGRMDGLDRSEKVIHVAPTLDADGQELIPRRRISYDTLVLAVGSGTNDFGTRGVAQHAISLNTPEQATHFHQRMVNACVRASLQNAPLRPEQLQITIIGAGATGVELAAELRNTTRELVAYGRESIDPDRDIRLTLIEAGDRILPALPPELSHNARRLLENLNVTVLTGEKVTEVTVTSVLTASGKLIPSELVVWAAGVKAPDFLSRLDGLETNRLNQLVVTPTLQTTLDPAIFALGDCAACPWEEKQGWVPPRAQAAHQQATLLLANLKRQLQGKPLRTFAYRDLGSLISLGKYSTVGSLMSSLSRKSLFIQGQFARLMYLSLYSKHKMALYGLGRTCLATIGRLLSKRAEPQVKLH